MATYDARPMYRKPGYYPWSPSGWGYYRADHKHMDHTILPPPGRYKVSRTGYELIVIPIDSTNEIRFIIETYGEHPVELDTGINDDACEVIIGEDHTCVVVVQC